MCQKPNASILAESRLRSLQSSRPTSLINPGDAAQHNVIPEMILHPALSKPVRSDTMQIVDMGKLRSFVCFYLPSNRASRGRVAW